MKMKIKKQSNRPQIYIALAFAIFALFIFLFSENNQNLSSDTTVEAPVFKVTAAGDYGGNNNTKKVTELINHLAPDFHIALGDLSYSEIEPEDAWCKFMSEGLGKVPMLLVAGNHESKGEDGDIRNFAKCMPFTIDVPMDGEYTKHYYFDYPKNINMARFIFISPDLEFLLENGKKEKITYNRGTPEFTWLDNALADAREKNIEWIIVSMHKPCLSTEGKDCVIGESLSNYLIKAGTDIVLDGHAHLYERTYQLKCVQIGRFDDTCISNSSKEEYQKGEGTVFVTVGTGGVNLRDYNSGDEERNYFASIFSKNQNPFYGVSSLKISKNSLEVLFIDSGEKISRDKFVIKK